MRSSTARFFSLRSYSSANFIFALVMAICFSASASALALQQCEGEEGREGVKRQRQLAAGARRSGYLRTAP